MPPIDPRKDYKLNVAAEQAFLDSEKLSKENMNKTYKQLANGERVNEKGSSSKE